MGLRLLGYGKSGFNKGLAALGMLYGLKLGVEGLGFRGLGGLGRLGVEGLGFADVGGWGGQGG